MTEGAIRNFTIGRSNWMLMNTVKGADVSSYIYSLAESARLNDLKPYDYINYVLSYLPEKDLNDERVIEQIILWSERSKELYNIKKS